jgi:hypothetical protein
LARHDVDFKVPPSPLGVADIQFTVRQNGRKFGELLVSNGTVIWKPANKTYGRRLSWKQLDEAVRKKGRRHKPTF